MSEQPPRPSKYRITRVAGGFFIDAPDRNRVDVELRATHFHVSTAKKGKKNYQDRIGLFEYQRLLNLIAGGLMSDWEPPDHGPKPWPGIKCWAVGKTRRAISPLVYQQWKLVLEKADERVVAVQKSIFAATFGCAPITLNTEFYRDHLLVGDVLKYRAAAIAVRYAEDLTQIKLRHLNSELRQQGRDHEEIVKSVRHLRLRIGDDLVNEGTQLNFLKQWLDLFAEGRSYTSLRRTLMNLPGGIAGRLLINLPAIQLERPVSRRLELIGLLLIAEHQNPVNGRLFQFSSEKQIRAAMEIVGRSHGRQLSTRATSDVLWFVNQIASFPEQHHGNIVGLAEKTTRWQRDQNATKLKKLMAIYGRDAKVRHPPIDFPNSPEIRFLGTPGEIFEEGIRMNHCIESMIPDAIDGKAYIFHVEKFGYSATALVPSNGRLCQAAGPFNQSNRASRWASRILLRWSHEFKR